MKIVSYNHSQKEAFSALIADYFIRALESDIPEDIVRGKLMDIILGQWETTAIHIALATVDDTPIGFSIYQIDTTESDWCKRPGWGFIREFYVDPGYRKQGFGAALADYTEIHLRQLGAAQLYLTSSGGISFWQRCGWKLTDELCSNGQYILEK